MSLQKIRFYAVCKYTINKAFKESNLKEQKYIKVNKIQNMRVSVKRQECVKQKKRWWWSTDHQMKQSKYRKFIVWLKSVKTRTHLTFSILFGLHKSDELEVGHVLSYYNKNQLPSLASTHLVFFWWNPYSTNQWFINNKLAQWIHHFVSKRQRWKIG